MKKTVAAILCCALALTALAGCSSNLPKGYSPLKASEQAASSEAAPPEEQPQSGSAAEKPVVPSSGALRTGLAVTTTVSSSKDAGEEDGAGQADSTAVAVLVDGAGRIVDVKIDVAQSKLTFDKSGKLTGDPSAALSTKRELGADYGMVVASGIGKEWYEQAAALEDYVRGKTAEEVKGIPVNEEGKPPVAELASSVTFGVGGFRDAVAQAAESAQELGAQAGDRLGMGIVTAAGSSKDAGDEDGLVQIDTTYAAATFGADGKITSCALDSTQSKIGFDRAGKLTGDVSAPVKTKTQLGEEYGMKKASGIGKEWNEQAAAYAQYAAGKTVEELAGIAVNEHGSATTADLTSSVTIGIGTFNDCIGKAAADAQ